MIQDIGPHRLYNQYERRTQPQPEDVVFAMENGKVLMKDSTSFPRVGELGMALPYVYLFAVDETRFFLLREPAQYPPEWEMVEVRSLRGNPNVEKHIIFAAMTAKHLSDWYRDSRFCGRCGGGMVHSEKERAMCCPVCGSTVYPRIMPAVIVGVIHGEELLVTRYRVGYRHNALVAGFTEIGETAE